MAFVTFSRRGCIRHEHFTFVTAEVHVEVVRVRPLQIGEHDDLRLVDFVVGVILAGLLVVLGLLLDLRVQRVDGGLQEDMFLLNPFIIDNGRQKSIYTEFVKISFNHRIQNHLTFRSQT